MYYSDYNRMPQSDGVEQSPMLPPVQPRPKKRRVWPKVLALVL